MKDWLNVKFEITLVIVLCLVSGAIGYRLHGQPDPSPDVKVAEVARSAAIVQAAKQDTIYQTKAKTLTATLTQYDTVRTHDTVTVDHVVYVNAAVADQSVKACKDEQSACSVRHSADSAVISKDSTVIASLKADKPSRLHTVLHDALWFGAGYASGRFNVGANVKF